MSRDNRQASIKVIGVFLANQLTSVWREKLFMVANEIKHEMSQADKELERELLDMAAIEFDHELHQRSVPINEFELPAVTLEHTGFADDDEPLPSRAHVTQTDFEWRQKLMALKLFASRNSRIDPSRDRSASMVAAPLPLEALRMAASLQSLFRKRKLIDSDARQNYFDTSFRNRCAHYVELVDRNMEFESRFKSFKRYMDMQFQSHRELSLMLEIRRVCRVVVNHASTILSRLIDGHD